LIFQIIDDRKNCIGYYYNGDFIYQNPPVSLNQTWEWNKHLAGREVEYARLWTNGEKLDDCCPPHLADRYEIRSKKIKAFLRATSTAKIKFDDTCLFDIIPEQHLRHYYELRNEICEWVFKNYTKPKNHALLVSLSEMIYDISQNVVRIDLNRLFRHSKVDTKARYLFEQVKGENSRIMYDLWGSKTGRLTTKQGSFPILNLKKEIADCVVPTNDVFVQFDFNGAEIRTLLSLSGEDQPQQDIHEWNIENVFDGELERPKAKQKFFAWLYNANASNEKIEQFYNRDQILKKHYNNNIVSTPFGRELESDDFHALNYLLQSSSSDNCLKQAAKINKFLSDKGSFLHSAVHDSITIDMKYEDRNLLPQIKEIFEDTDLGLFASSTHIGPNLKNLEVLEW
jgi:hypothetical protein